MLSHRSKLEQVRKMMASEYVHIMTQALEEPYGLRLVFSNAADRTCAMRKFYRIRDQLRQAGDSRFDILSLIRCNPTELLMFRRDRISNSPRDDGLKPHHEV